MQDFSPSIVIKVNEGVYLKAPDSSVLGQNIIAGSIDLIDELGFENFNFKKLATHISSTEASIYRYFESKHHVLVYLVLWYWGWTKYKLILRTANISDPCDRLQRCIKVLTEVITEDSDFSNINEVKLNKIVISESSKVYLNKKVDEENALGYFKAYKDIVEFVSTIITEVNPVYKYPNMLISTIIEGAHHQRFFTEHLPRLTDIHKGEDAIVNFYQTLVLNEIKR